MLIKQKFIALILLLNLISTGVMQTFADSRDRNLKVMTYNMYLGAELGDIFAAQSAPEVLLEVAEAYSDMLAGNVPERISAIADQIENSEPDVVGLQEVAMWRVGAPFDSAPATTVTYDFLQMLLADLESRNLNYAAIATKTNLDAELPAVFGPEQALDIRFTDRVVILARTDLPESEFKLEATDAQSFATNLEVSVLGLPVTIFRGWTSADIKHRGKPYRFINTHVESYYEPIQLAQVSELLQGPANSNLPVITVGDFNSDAAAAGTAYGMFLAGGFTDAWDVMPPTMPSYTWPLSDEIPDTILSPTQRLDLIMTRGAVLHYAADVVGEDPVTDLTPSGFRPSDHASVTASFVLEP